MFWINLKIGFRNIIKHKVFSFINIFGLAVSMSVCLLILSIVFGLSDYDRFHKNYNRIYRVLTKETKQEGFKATTPMPIRNALINEYAGIEKVVSFKRGFGGDAAYDDKSIPMFGFFCSDEFFDVFSFQLINGDPQTALKDPFSVVLTSESAYRLFGDTDPIGKIIRFNERGLVLAGIPNKNRPTYLGDFTIKGVIEEFPGKSHLEFDILASLSTLSVLELQNLDNTLQDNWKDINNVYSFVLLEEDKDEDYLESILNNIAEQKYARYEDFSVIFTAQPLSKITPGKLYSNPISYRLPVTAIYFLTFLAVVIMLSACLNYTNLSLAKSLTRAREVGIRKVSGAYRYQILFQFIGESILVSVLSLVFAIGLLELLKPAYNGLWITQYFKVSFENDAYIYLIFLGLSVCIGIIGGILPAIYLSSFKPLKVLQESTGIKVFRRISLRKALIVVQFMISLFFIITTTLIYFQLRYLANAEYGFDKENIINIPLHGNDYTTYANTITGHTGIVNVSGSSVVLATGGTGSTVLRNVNDLEDSLGVSQMSADPAFLENLQLRIIAGTGFPERVSEKSEQYLIVNEIACEKLGYTNANDIIGASFIAKDIDKPLTVVGVVKNFHYSNLISAIGPFVIRYIPDDFRFINIRIDPLHRDETLSFLEVEWKKIDHDHAFKPEYMDYQLMESHAFIGDIGQVIGFVSVIAISIACLGLLGMVIFVTQSKIKEIGIRKVHGATTSNIILQLSRGFFIMLIIAMCIAVPLAKLANNAWLVQFAVRVQFGIEIISVGVLIMIILGLTTILSQTIRAARTNPADILRYE